MLSFLSKFIPAIISWGIFIFVIFFIEYPKSLTEANFLQLFLFFSSLFAASILTFIMVVKSFVISSLFSLAVVILLVLKGLGSLNLVSGGLTVLAIGLLVSYFRKNKTSSRLTSPSGIPKLTHMRKHKVSS